MVREGGGGDDEVTHFLHTSSSPLVISSFPIPLLHPSSFYPFPIPHHFPDGEEKMMRDGGERDGGRRNDERRG